MHRNIRGLIVLKGKKLNKNMFRCLKDWIYKEIKKYILRAFPDLLVVQSSGRYIIADVKSNCHCGDYTRIYSPFHLFDVQIGDYTYVAQNSYISRATIGKCCSIGPNLICGWGIHPIDTISTHPMFYSTKKQNGMTLSSSDKIEEVKHIDIGNDVFIGANVTILDGVKIGDGAVIGAGAIVSKDIPPYAVAVGCPIRILRFRFPENIRNKLLEIKWWNFSEDNLKDVERMIFDVDAFVEKYSE